MLIIKNKVLEYKNIVTSTPLVSVCITTYNHEKYIEECLDSILSQETNFAFEICLGEDNSSDNTRELCERYALKNPEKIRLFLHHRENVIYFNNGATGRFNFLYNFTQANGKYIALCDGDDYWADPRKLQKQVDYLENNSDCSLVFSDINHLIANGDQKLIPSVLKTRNSIPNISNYKDIISKNYIPTCTVVIRNWFKNKGIPSSFTKYPMGDWPLWLFTGKHGYYYFLKDTLANYRIHNNGIWSTKTSSHTVSMKIKTLRLLSREKIFNWKDKLLFYKKICRLKYQLFRIKARDIF